MKTSNCLSALFITLIFYGCGSSYYEPDYEGRFVISDLQLGACYRIPEETFRTCDSVIKCAHYRGFSSENYSSQNQLTKTLQIVVLPEEKVVIRQRKYLYTYDSQSKYALGMKVLLINASDDTIHIIVQDLSVKMIQEAQDKYGIWQPIECWNNSMCGNSYRDGWLPPNTYFETTALRYKGDFKTKLRFKWEAGGTFIDSVYVRNYVYSEPFDGSVNYSQLGKKEKTNPWVDYLE